MEFKTDVIVTASVPVTATNIGATGATAAAFGLRSARQLGSGTTLIAAERARRGG